MVEGEQVRSVETVEVGGRERMRGEREEGEEKRVEGERCGESVERSNCGKLWRWKEKGERTERTQ